MDQNGLGLALRLHELGGLHHHGVSNEAVRAVADQDLACRRRLLEARGGVHRIAGNECLPSRGITSNHFAGVDARARDDLDAGIAHELFVEHPESLTHLGGRPDGPQGVVLVDLRDAEHGHHCIPDELLDRATVAFQHGTHCVEVPSHHPSERFGIEALAERRRAGDVREEYRDGLADLTGILGRERRSARLAEAGPV
jgi:hypothetical protein